MQLCCNINLQFSLVIWLIFSQYTYSILRRRKVGKWILLKMSYWCSWITFSCTFCYLNRQTYSNSSYFYLNIDINTKKIWIQKYVYEILFFTCLAIFVDWHFTFFLLPSMELWYLTASFYQVKYHYYGW